MSDTADEQQQQQQQQKGCIFNSLSIVELSLSTTYTTHLGTERGKALFICYFPFFSFFNFFLLNINKSYND